MKPTLYVETSIFSHLTSHPSRDKLVAPLQEWTRFWWKNRREGFDLYVSQTVLGEISLGDPAAAKLRLAAAKGIPELEATKTMRRFARKIARRLALPPKVRLDAFHLAFAIDNGIDYLLTWNLRHISNPANGGILREMSAARGLRLPEIVTPYDLLRGGENA